MSKIITLPKVEELDLNIQKEITKLPTQAMHNELHNLAVKSQAIREQAENCEIVALILCGVELEFQYEQNKLRNDKACQEHRVTDVLNWKDWVKQNCEYSYMTSTKYRKLARCGRAGEIDNLDPDLIPSLAPSQMTAKEQQEACITIAKSLQHLRGIRQLYIELEIIALPSDVTIEQNRNKKGAKPTKGKDSPPAKFDPELERSDAKAAIIPTLKPLDEFFTMNRHTLLSKTDLKEMDDALVSARDIIKVQLEAVSE